MLKAFECSDCSDCSALETIANPQRREVQENVDSPTIMQICFGIPIDMYLHLTVSCIFNDLDIHIA